MNIVEFLEKLACIAHHKINMNELLSGQPLEVKNAFLTNDAAFLKIYLNRSEILADKSSVFQLES